MDIEVLEQLALGEDRGAARKALLPGTVEHDYWHGVALQHEGRLDEVDKILASWSERHGSGYSEPRDRLRRRQLLLRADTNLSSTSALLQRELGVVLDDRAEVVVQAQRFPTKLDPATIDGDTLLRAELEPASIDHIQEDALPAALELVSGDLTAQRRVLERLTRSNIPDLVERICLDLATKSSTGFGSVGVHHYLTLAQLEEVASMRPAVRAESAWVTAMLVRLRPASWVDVQLDTAEREAFLERLQAFVTTLGPSFNTLKAEVLHARLIHDRALGIYDRARFVAYLALPRNTAWSAREWLSRFPTEQHVQQHSAEGRAIGIAAIGDDTPLVVDYLAHFLRLEDGRAFDSLRPEWVAEQLAITRLLDPAGASADAERWAKVLGPARLAALRDRVDIDLAPQNPVAFRADQAVVLEVDVKNVRELEVKVFRIDALSYFLAKGAEVDTSIDLDGMVPSGHARIVASSAPPLHRVRQRIELPACVGPGTYVVELIGNGRSSRALIRKGSLRHAVRNGAAGAVVTIMNEDGVPLADARLWLGGRELAPRISEGATEPTITIPFSTTAGNASVLLVHGDVTQRASIAHGVEHVQLYAGMHLERESLVPNQTGRLLLRPSLYVGGAPAPLALVEDAYVDIRVTDLAGTSSSRTERVSLRDDAETVVTFHVPDGLTNFELVLRGRVRVVSLQRTIDVSANSATTVNGIHATELVAAVHLARTTVGDAPHHELYVRGKTGEPLPERAVAILLEHRAVSTPVTVTLETNERGAIELGDLAGIVRLEATLVGGTAQTWWFDRTVATPVVIHALADAPIILPIAVGTRLADLSLAELRGGANAVDMTSRIVLADRCATMTLPSGEYQLQGSCFKAPIAITVLPQGGAGARPGWAVAGPAIYELTPPLPVVRTFAQEDDALVMRIAGARAGTRVHIVATTYDSDSLLSPPLGIAAYVPTFAQGRPVLSHYVSGRDIGDEYRYVLERRHAARRPGTLLEKPSLLLNPWALRTTSTGHQAAAIGGAYPQSPPAAMPMMAGAASYGRASNAYDSGSEAAVTSPTIDFLARGAIVLDNLRPDADGIIRVPLADLGDAQFVQAFVVDPLLTSTLELALPPRPLSARDLRLRLALDPAHHYAEDRSVVGAPAGTQFVVPDVRTGKIELIDSLARAHQLLLTLGADGDLREMAFVTEWASLDETTRRARYSKYACHELNLFLWRRDHAFFDAVVRPYLAHKRDKTFVDHFLLGDDLASYLEPWAFGRLNSVERILLAVRLPAVRDGIARLFGDAVDVLPPDPERDARLLATLLGASATVESSDTGETQAMPEMLDMDMDASEQQKERRTSPPPASRSLAPPMKAKRKGAPPPPPPGASFGRGGGGHADGFAADLAERDRSEPLFRGADKTQEWAETGWWKRRIAEQTADLVRPNRYWRDLAWHVQSGKEGPFLSPYLADSTQTFAEAMCALAFLDLPFVAAVHERKLEEMSLTVVPKSHALAARTHIIEVAEQADTKSVLIGQSYFRSDDRWDWDGGEQREKYVAGELIAGVVYRCQVVVTNPTSRRQKLDVLLQIPRGAIPVASGFVTRTVHLQLAPYATESTEYAFYFPRPGRFTHYPAHVTKDLVLQAAAEARELEVVSRPTQVDLASWSHVSQHGTLEEVLAFLERANLARTDLQRIAWRMHDRAAFEQVTALLVTRHVFDARLWRYAFAHQDARRLGEWLRHQDQFLAIAGPVLERPLIQLDPVERGWYQHLEYAPLINARAHQLGARRKILNDALATQYRAFLDVVAHRKAVGAKDLLGAAHYLLSMDRVEDALAVLGRIDAPDEQLQQDYLRAYCACYQGDLARARELAARWAEQPVDRWRHRFAALLGMLDEVEGTTRAQAQVDPDNRVERMNASAQRQPALEVSASGTEIILQHHNLAACQLRFFKMDIELVFSRQPFVQGDVERFSFIEPGLVLDVALGDDAGGRTVLPIPAALRGANLVIQATGPGLRKSIAHYAHDLGVHLAHAYGQVRVVRGSTQKALPATYVKVYGRKRGGQIAFFKDGYTDLRGTFDYATLSTDDLDHVERLALLIASDDAGATIIEAAPPPR